MNRKPQYFSILKKIIQSSVGISRNDIFKISTHVNIEDQLSVLEKQNYIEKTNSNGVCVYKPTQKGIEHWVDLKETLRELNYNSKRKSININEIRLSLEEHWISLDDMKPESTHCLPCYQDSCLRFYSVLATDMNGHYGVRNRILQKNCGIPKIDEQLQKGWYWNDAGWEPTHWMPMPVGNISNN